jgi:hypothetical protein
VITGSPTTSGRQPHCSAQILTLVDDLDGSTEVVGTFKFGWLGRDYEIDLGPASFAKLEKAIGPFVEKARQAGPSANSRMTASAANRFSSNSSTRGAERDYDLPQLREWAAKNKITIPTRGRIPASVVEQFKAAGSIG